MFNLNTSIAAWRRTLEQNRAFRGEDIDELEQHLRDQIAALRETGAGDKEAFQQAMTLMGDYATAEGEYQKVYWKKLRHRRMLGLELQWRFSMLRNYAKTALRSLVRHKGYASINLLGLAIGLAGFILISLFVEHELSYDRFHEKADRIHRIVQWQPGNVYLGTDYFAVTPAILAPTLVEDYSEVEAATAVNDREALLSLDEQNLWEHGLLADERFFEVFSFPLLSGDAGTALAQPNSIILSQTLARKLFGDASPVGRTLRYQQEEDVYTVTGVVADVPASSSLQFSFMVSASSDDQYRRDMGENAWSNNSWYTFFVLAEGSDATRFEANMPALVEKYLGKEGDDPEKRNQYMVQALRDVHLRSRFNFDLGGLGSITYVYLFSAIGVVILLLACVNYTNLAMARSVNRAREVGMRKVVGAVRGQLFGQFLGESVLTASLALALALGLVHLLLPTFGHLVERPLRMDYLGSRLLLPGLPVLIVLVGVLSGSYPAFFMASLRPIRVLMGTAAGKTGRFRVQRLLIVGQFAASIALVASSFVVYQQLRFVQHKELGYNREHVVAISARDGALEDNYEAIRAGWLSNPNVVAVSASQYLPTSFESSTHMTNWEGHDEGPGFPIYHTRVDYDYLDVFGLQLVAGRTFSRDRATDAEKGYLINETAAQALGWTPEEAVGKHIVHNGEKTVIGVVKDFHMHSMHLAIQPMMLYLNTSWFRYISAKVRPHDLPGTLALMERSVKQHTSFPFEYQFLDDHFDALYNKEVRLGETFGFFTILALLIASLGLFGLAAFAAEQRTKEIGIRKVLGANVAGLVALLSQDFLKLVGIAFLVGTPLAYFAMERWLEDFAYRVELGPGLFLLSGLAALGIALAAVSYQAIRAALADPVQSLRYE